MKKLITISLFIFWTVVVAILISGLVFYQNNKGKLSGNFAGTVSAPSDSSSNTAGSLAAGVNPANSPAALASNQAADFQLSLSEIAKHNTSGSCWLLINNKVYDVTSFILAHPGGASTIIPNCGKESTQAFNTKGGSTPHSSTANSMLAAYLIGNFNEQIGQQQVQQNIQTTNTVIPPTNGRDEEDDD